MLDAIEDRRTRRIGRWYASSVWRGKPEVTAIIALLGLMTPVLHAEDWRNIRTGWEIPERDVRRPAVHREDRRRRLAVRPDHRRRPRRGEGPARRHHAQHGPGPHLVEAGRRRAGRRPRGVLRRAAEGPGGRIYAFYNHNTDNLREVKGDNPPYKDGWCTRVDSLGYFVFKYSDDHGRTWSAERYAMPVREMEIDRENPYGGKVRYFWNVGQPFVHGGAPTSRCTRWAASASFFTRSEGVLLKSTNILTERDPEKITWETLPDGDVGLRTPPGGGPIAEEQSFCGAQRRLVLLRLPHDRRPSRVRLQPRRRPHLEHAAVCPLRRRPAHEAPARGQFRLEVQQRQVPLLVPQPRRPIVRGPQSGLALRRRRGRLARRAR